MLTLIASLLPALWGCAPTSEEPPDSGAPAEYVGTAACSACHTNLGASFALHGHSQILERTLGSPPEYPGSSLVAGVPTPPDALGWSQIDYVIGGYRKAARFVDINGYVINDASLGVPAQYNLRNLVADLPAQFVSYPGEATPQPYDITCFRCHTTAPRSVAENGGERQNNRPGIGGTWVQDGVQCEACHGPGSRHIGDPPAGNIIVDVAPSVCTNCHSGADRYGVNLAASGRFIRGGQQAEEVAASPHAGFVCTICHNPHASATYDTANGIRNACTSCHADQTMALHEGRVYVLDDYVETLTCTSCHMPFATSYASSNTFAVGSDFAHIGDTRTHLMYIAVDFGADTFTPDGSQVALDADGHGAITVDYVCLRCHHGRGSAFELSGTAARVVADGIHQ